MSPWPQPTVCTPKWSLTVRSTTPTAMRCPIACARPLASASGSRPRSAAATGPVPALGTKGVTRRSVLRVDRCADELEATTASEGPLTLNADQLVAWAPVEQAVRQGGFHAFLLYGVTGSGKTEIYLRAIE